MMMSAWSTSRSRFGRKGLPIARSAESRGIVKSIVDLARNLGLVVVAEGAEHTAQVDELQRLGCDLVQGFVFYRPVDAATMCELLMADETPAELAAKMGVGAL